MNKVKKQFKDFWCFYRLTSLGINNQSLMSSGGMRNWFWQLLLLMVGTMIVGMQMLISLNGTTITINYLWIAMFAMSFSIGWCTAIKPSVLSVAPFTPVQRIVFSYLTVILNTLVFMVFITLFGLVFILIVALMVFIFTGENILIIDDSIIEEEIAVTANGNWLIALCVLFCVFAFLSISHLNKTKLRLIASGVVVAVMEIFALVLCNLCAKADGVGHFVGGYFVVTSIDHLAHPWIVLLLLGIADIAACAISLFCVIQRHRSSKI